MNVFITGATGFIGSHLADRLLQDESINEVRCLVRNREKWLSGKTYIRVNGDLHSLKALQNAMDGVDIVFHFAATLKAKTQKEFDYANVEATENLIRIAQKKKVKRIIVLSSLAAAGPSIDHPKTEDDPMMPVSMYGESKKRMELMIHKIADNLPVTIIRPPAVYGPREEDIYILFKMMSKRICPIVGDGNKPKLSIVYINDLIDGILLAAGHDHSGIETYFLSGPEISSWNQIRNISSKVLGRRNIPLYIRPGWVKKIAGAVETTASFFGSYPIINRDKANEMIHEWTCSHEKAEKEYGYQPLYSLDEGISRTIHWYKKHHWL